MDEEKRTSTEPISYTLDHVQFTGGDQGIPTATVKLIGPDGESITDACTGNGPVDAVCNAIDRAIGTESKLVDFNVQAVTEGIDSQGTVRRTAAPTPAGAPTPTSSSPAPRPI